MSAKQPNRKPTGKRKESDASAQEGRERKRAAKRKGLKAGSRQQVEQAGKKSGSKQAKDPRIGSRKPIVLIADEKDSVNLFARKRLSYDCDVSEIRRDTPEFQTIVGAMKDRFGPTIDMLSSLPDFRLVRLHPTQGVWVRGFAQATPVSGFPKPNSIDS